MSITDITGQLAALAERHERGELSREEIGEMTDLARQLYEHMIVIRSKAMEPVKPAPAPERVVESEPRYEADNPEISPNQISLIDSIEEIKKSETLNDTVAEGGESLSQRYGSQGIMDLVAAITINQKFSFISNLFGGDQAAYEGALAKLNAFSSFLEADEYIENVIKDRYDWESNSPVVKDFTALIERKFL